MGQLRKRLFARYYDRLCGDYEQGAAEGKRALLARVAGTVLEIGPGTGANLSLLPAGVNWIGVEPNRHMHAPLAQKAAELGLEADVRELSADRLPLDDGSVDFAISTLVLCSVPDPASAIAEIRRVLRPGGQLLFWEHVAAPTGTGLRRWQRWLTPLSRFCADGCRLDRDTGTTLREAGFASIELEDFRMPRDIVPAWVAPHVRGAATR